MTVTPQMHLEFAHRWRAEILSAPPMIAPARQFVYPQRVAGEDEAMARGALQLRVRPDDGAEFLATCALGFEAATMPTGVWSCPDPEELCAVAGGYAYVLRTSDPAVCSFLPLRPVVSVHAASIHAVSGAVSGAGLLVFAGFHSLLGWDAAGEKWQTARLTWEGLRITEITADEVRGFGWHMPSDTERPFAVSLADGTHTGGAFTD